MSGEATGRAPYEAAFESYGVRLAVESDDAKLLTSVMSVLPPGSKPCARESVTGHFRLRTDDDLGYVISSEGEADIPCRDLELAISTVQMQIRWHVALHARNYVFIHAGVVVHGGRALLLPGHSFTGKTTLVAALVRAGASYYSDEYAVLDEKGQVNPYPHPLSIRDRNGRARPRTVESIGGSSGDGPAPVGLIAITAYVPGTEWEPDLRSVGQGVVALMEHAVPVLERPDQTLAALRAALTGARVLEGPRGEAEPVAAALLEELA